MIPTPTEEIRAIRRELATEFGNDVHRIAEETRRRQRESGRAFLSLPPRHPLPRNATIAALHPSGGDAVSGIGVSSRAAG